MPQASAPNRLLDLADLETPEFRSVLDRLDGLLERDPVSYLHPGKRWEYPWAIQRARLRSASRILNAGCGDSIFPVFLSSLGHQVTALDLDFTANLGELHELQTHYVRGSLTELPYEGESFDAAFCISVIEHLDEGQIPVAMQELRRVLRPGGRLLLTTDFYEDADANLHYTGPGRDPFPVDWGIFDEERLRRLILDAPGFHLEGDLDLSVDWDEMRERMRAYHGYPYTSVGVTLIRS
jgi:SAM-dependent methyltransferase